MTNDVTPTEIAPLAPHTLHTGTPQHLSDVFPFRRKLCTLASWKPPLKQLSGRSDHRTQCRGGHRPGGLHHQKAEAGCQRVCQAGHDLQRRVLALLLHTLHCGLREHQPRRHQHPLHHWVSVFCLSVLLSVTSGYFRPGATP